MRILSSTSFAGFITFSSILCLDFTCAMVSSDSIAEFTRIHSDFKRLAVSQPNYKHDAFSEGRISPEADSDSSPESSSVSPAPSSLSNSSSDSEENSPNPPIFSELQPSKPVTVHHILQSNYKPITRPYIYVINQNSSMYIYGCSEAQIRSALRGVQSRIQNLTILNCQLTNGRLPQDIFYYFPNLRSLNVFHCGLQSLDNLPSPRHELLFTSSRDEGEPMFLSNVHAKIKVYSQGVDLENDLARQNMLLHTDEYNKIILPVEGHTMGLGEVLSHIGSGDHNEYLNLCLENRLSKDAILALCYYWKVESRDYDGFYDSLMMILERYEPAYSPYFIWAVDNQFQEEDFYQQKEEEYDAARSEILQKQFMESGRINDIEDQKAHKLHDQERQRWIIQKKCSALQKVQKIREAIIQQHTQRNASGSTPAVSSNTGASLSSNPKP